MFSNNGATIISCEPKNI